MPTRIHFKDAGYRSGGRLTTISWGEVHRQLASLGATALSTTATPDFFIAGSGARSKESKARSKGVPILTEVDLLEALEVGYFDYEEHIIDADLDVNTVISELRSSFDGAPSSESWTRCLELIERCPEDQLDPVLHYITQGVAGWQDRSVQWQPSHTHDLLTGVTKIWLKGCPEDELCVAPPLWLYEMTRAKQLYHPKHRLIRALNLDEMRMSLNHYQRVLDNPHMTNLRILNMGTRSNCSESVFKSLSSCSAMSGVEELWLHGGIRQMERGLDRHADAFKHIKRIRVFSTWLDTGLVNRIRQFPCFDSAPLVIKAQPYST